MESFDNIVARLALLVQARHPIITIESRDEPVLMKERVEQLRAWAAQRCVPAS